MPLAEERGRGYGCGVSRTDEWRHGWLRRAVTQPDFAAGLAVMGAGAGELVLDHVAEASHGFFVALLHEAAKDRQQTRVNRVSPSKLQLTD